MRLAFWLNTVQIKVEVNRLHVHTLESRFQNIEKKYYYAYNHIDINSNYSSNHAIYMALPLLLLYTYTNTAHTLPFIVHLFYSQLVLSPPIYDCSTRNRFNPAIRWPHFFFFVFLTLLSASLFIIYWINSIYNNLFTL